MNLQTMIEQAKQHLQFDEAGVLLCHCGVIRSASRNGLKV